MEHREEIANIKGTFVNGSKSEGELFCLKRAYQESRRILIEEFKTKRKQLANRLKSRRLFAWKLGRDLGLKTALAETSETMLQAKEAYETSLANANRDCLELALSVAKEIVQAEISVNIEGLTNRIKKSLEALLSSEKAIISIPEKNSELIAKALNTSAVSIRIDNSIEPGNARIESERGIMELNWISQLNIIEQQLKEKLENKILQNRA